nr:CDP-glycerol glycerophosphotransferase family protein [uncultured Bacteroides sp.]
MRKRLEYILKHNLIIQQVYRLIMSNLFRLVGLFVKTDENLVLISSFAGLRYNDSPKVISEYLTSHNEYQHLDIIWALEKPDEIEIPGCKKVKIDSLSYFLTALKAKYWITNVNIERGLHFKKKSTKFLNTWHGISFNKCGNAVNGRKDFDCSNVDLFLYQCQYEKDIFIRDFNALEEKLALTGLPRNDELYHVTDSKVASLKNKLNIPHEKKVILYAPTWRDSTDSGKSYVFKSPMDLKYWEEKLGDEYVLLYRVHHFVTKLLGVKFNDFVRDVSNYSTINDLMIVSDILVSDYSATLADFSILERPIICFGYDYKEYAANRGFYLDMNIVMPSGVLHTQEEVVNYIKNMDYRTECEKTVKVKKNFLEAGGNATEKSVNLFFNGA